MTISERILKVLKDRNMTQVEFAKQVGIATSTFYIGADLGQGLGPVICGKISDYSGYTTMFYCVAALIVIAMAGFNHYQKKENNCSKFKGGFV